MPETPDRPRPAPRPQPPAGGESAAHAGIVAVVLVYAAFAALWILLSDRLLVWLVRDPVQISLLSTLKGWVFVAVTSALLFHLMQRLLGSTAQPGPGSSPPRLLTLPVFLASLAILGITGLGIANALREQKATHAARLQTVTDLKSRQLRDWLRERTGGVRFAESSRLWSDAYFRWRDRGDAEAREWMTNRLQEYIRLHGFQAVHLLHADGEPFWDSEPIAPGSNPALLREARLAAARGQGGHLGPYRDEQRRLHLDFLAVLPAAGPRPGPLLVFHTDPAAYLFPLLEWWPIPSPTGESLLFRKDAEQVVFLNELRHRKGSAANLRVPLGESNLLAGQVLQGNAPPGAFLDGPDYRGHHVLGVAQPVPGTDWFLLSKVDRSEVFAGASEEVVWIGLSGLLAGLILLAGAFLFRQRQELALSLRTRDLQAERLQALELLHGISSASPDAIFAKDLEGKYQLFNPEASRIAGKPASEVLGKDDRALWTPEEAETIRRRDREVMRDNRTSTIEQNLTTALGPRVFLATKGPLRDAGGRVIGVFGISRDVTEQRLAESEQRRLQAEFLQAQKMESIGRLAGGVAHDFNNMLGVIVAHADLALLRGNPSERIQADLEEIKHTAQRSADLTKQLLAFARKQTIAPKILDLNTIVRGLMKMLGRLIGENIALTFTQREGLWRVRIDPTQVDQVLANLAVNARDAIPGVGQVTIRTDNAVLADPPDQAHPYRLAGEFVLLEVKDSGSGMPPEVLDKIFEPFFTTKDLGHGTGLGLATVYGIVKQNEGFIEVDSRIGQGTEFRIYLPRHVGEEAEPPVPKAPMPQGRGEAILVVEDERTNLETIQSLLLELGYRVLAATRPGEALALLGEGTVAIDLLLTDVIMPEMNGRELADRARLLRPGLECLFMSGYTADAIASHGVLEEDLRFLPKPFTLEELALKVRESLDHP